MTIVSERAPKVSIGGAADFLSAVAAGGRIAVTAITPDGPLDSAVFDTNTETIELTGWLEARNGSANLYYSLNEPRPGATGRLKEADVTAIRGLAVDLDPRAVEEAEAGGFERERTRLLGLADEWASHFLAPPSAVIDSGNGIQMVWLFPQPLPNTIENRMAVKAQAKGIGVGLGSDAVQSVDHLFRIPFTENLPNAKKRAKGRKPAPVRLLHHDHKAAISLAVLKLIAAPIWKPPSAIDLVDFDYNAVIAAAEGEALPPDLAAMLEAVKAGPRGSTALSNGDRSARDFALACLVVEEGIVDPTALGQVTFALSPDKLRDKDALGYGEKYAASTIGRALAKAKPRPTADDFFQGAAATAAGPIANLPAPMPSFHVVRGIVDAKKLPVREWLVQPRLPIGDVTQITGEPGVSKSTFMIRDALAVATGREDILRGVDEHGRPITSERLHRGGAVLVYNAEDRFEEMQRRLAAAQRHHGVTDEQMKHPIILWSGVDGEPLKVMERKHERGPLQPAPELATLENAVKSYGVVLVILDPQISLARGAIENSNDDADAIMSELARLASRLGISLAVVHHTAKATRQAAGDMGAGRGGFAAVGKVRSAYTLVRVTGDGPGEKDWGVSPADRLIRLDSAKASHDEQPPHPIVFRRVSVAVGNGSSLTGTTNDLFEASPRDRLLAEGDRAPVLEVVDHRALAAAANAEATVKDTAKAEAVARIADDLLGDANEAAMSAFWKPMAERMSDAGLGTAEKRNTIVANITDLLGGKGVSINHAGQHVLIRAMKRGTHPTAPWWIERLYVEAPANA